MPCSCLKPLTATKWPPWRLKAQDVLDEPAALLDCLERGLVAAHDDGGHEAVADGLRDRLVGRVIDLARLHRRPAAPLASKSSASLRKAPPLPPLHRARPLADGHVDDALELFGRHLPVVGGERGVVREQGVGERRLIARAARLDEVHLQPRAAPDPGGGALGGEGGHERHRLRGGAAEGSVPVADVAVVLRAQRAHGEPRAVVGVQRLVPVLPLHHEGPALGLVVPADGPRELLLVRVVEVLREVDVGEVGVALVVEGHAREVALVVAQALEGLGVALVRLRQRGPLDGLVRRGAAVRGCARRRAGRAQGRCCRRSGSGPAWGRGARRCRPAAGRGWAGGR